MQTLLDIIQIEPQDGYCLRLQFENGAWRIFDMKPYLSRKPFDQLKAPGLFAAARVGLGTVVWPGGLDIDPETLWEQSVPE